VLDPTAPLAKYWSQPVENLATLTPLNLGPEDKERHCIFSLLLMKLVYAFWNGNKRGQDGEYPWRAAQRRGNGTYAGDKYGDRYLGHNIACLAIDGNGDIIDFDFNHNDLFSSSVEHAESRLVRRVFSLAQIYDDWHVRRPTDLPKKDDYAAVLSNVTVYTSLESCSQCSGIMALGQVKAVVYLQHDPGMYVIGNILHNLTTPGLRAPRPIAGSDFDFAPFELLNTGYAEFYHAVQDPSKAPPFYIYPSGDKPPDRTPSITSFLCTDLALSIFATHPLNSMVLSSSTRITVPPMKAQPNQSPNRMMKRLRKPAVSFSTSLTAGGVARRTNCKIVKASHSQLTAAREPATHRSSG